MKTQITVKRRITAILMIITLMLPVFNAPAFSTAGRPGELANFEMKVDNAGANILGTIIYIPGWNPDSHSNPMDESLNALESFIYINPVNVTQYIDGGTTSSLSTYYWTASSGDPSIATVTVEPDASNPNAENRLVFKGHKFGTVVITVNMSAVNDMSAVVTKTFTVRIVDASKHGTAEASFLKDGSSVDTEKTLDMKINAPVTLTIDKLLGNDYSDLSSSINYKNISNYKWTASVSNSDVIKLNANSTEISTQTINSDAPAEGSTKDIIITPVSEGDAAITVYFEPIGALSAVFGPFSCVIQARVTKSVGNLDFTITPGKKAYLAESAYEKIKDPYASTEPIGVDDNKDNDNNDAGDSGLGLTFKSQLAFASGSTFEPDLDSDVDVMFQKPTEPPVPAPTEPYDLDSDVDIMYQNKNTNNSTNNINSNKNNSNNNSSNNTNSNNANNNSNFEPDLDSDVDIMFQKPTEPPVPAPTEPYDLDSDVDIMFQNKNNNNSNNNTNSNNINNQPNNGNNNSNSNFEPDLDSDVDIMFQKSTEPPAEAPTEPYDLDSDVDIMFQNKNNNNSNNNTNSNNINNQPNNGNNNNNLYGDANGIPGAGLNQSYPVSPNLPLPGGDTSVSLTIDNFKALVNGEWEDTADMASAFFENSSDSSNFEITGYSYSYPAKITGEISNTGNTVIERRATDEQLALANKEQQIIIDIDNIVLQENFTVTVTVTSEIYKVTQSKAKTFQVTYINSDADGSISAITVKQDREIDVNEGQTVIAKIDKEGKGEDILIDVTRLDIVDFSGGFEEYIKTVSANSEAFAEYRFSITSSNTSVVRINSNVSSGVTLTPIKPGNVTITVQIKDKNNLNTLYTGKFNVSVTNIGVFSDEEGVLKSVTLKYGKETVYADYTLYMKAGSEMKIDISKVMELSASAKSSDGYARELKTYRWEAVSTNAEIVEVKLSTPQIGSIRVGADSHEDLKSFSLLSYANSFGTSTIKVTVTSAREDIEDIKEYSVTFKIIVNALGGKFMPVVQYDTETVKIALDVHEDSSGINYSYYEFDMSNSSGVPAPEYMYCLKAASDGASQTGEKWYPFMGSEMDISTLVPKGGSTPYRLAIREVDAVKLEDGNYSSADRHVALLYPRKTLSSAEKKAIVYRDGKIMLNSAGADPIDIYYKVELSGWLKGTISGTDGISFPGEIAPMGSVVQIKYASTLDYETNKYEFSSAIVKVKIPKAAKKPNIKINDKTGSYSGFTDKMEYTLTSPLAVSENGSSMMQNSPGMWIDCPKGTASYKDLNNKFPNLANAPVDVNGNVTLYIRTKATIKNDGSIKTPASEIVAMKIPADILG